MKKESARRNGRNDDVGHVISDAPPKSGDCRYGLAATRVEGCDFYASTPTEGEVMPTFEEARRIILEYVTPLGVESVELLGSLSRVLAEDVIAPWDLPSFDNSAMDGYAVRAADCQASSALPIIDYVPAGRRATKSVMPGTAIKIMTGAPLPDGADSIVPIEHAVESGGTVRVMQPVEQHQYVRFAGEDMRKGETVLVAGTLVRPYEINLLASFGKEYVTVVRKPKVAIVATGDELIALGETPSIGKIVNSNSYSLAAAITSAGAIPMLLGIARDDLGSHREKLAEGLKADVLITSAGVSVGDRDLVREVLEELGVEIVFWRVKVKPGKALHRQEERETGLCTSRKSSFGDADLRGVCGSCTVEDDGTRANCEAAVSGGAAKRTEEESGADASGACEAGIPWGKVSGVERWKTGHGPAENHVAGERSRRASGRSRNLRGRRRDSSPSARRKRGNDSAVVLTTGSISFYIHCVIFDDRRAARFSVTGCRLNEGSESGLKADRKDGVSQ